MYQLLSPRQITDIVVPAPIGTRLSVTWTRIGDWEPITSTGTIVARNTSSVVVHYSDLGEFPLPPRDPTFGVSNITLQTCPMTLKPIRLCNRRDDLDNPSITAHIYADGGARPSDGGPGAAAIHIVHRDGSTVAHSRHYASATNNIAEFISVIAAFRVLERHPEYSLVVIIVDSEFVYEALVGNRAVKDRKLTALFEEARLLFQRLCGRVILGHMLRRFGNPADTHASTAIASASGTGDQTLFADIVVPPSAPKIQRKMPRITVHNTDAPAISAGVINSVEDFGKSRFLRARSRAPDTAEHLWANLAHSSLKRILQADKGDARATASIDFLLTPSAFLPQRTSTKRVIEHLSSGVPFRQPSEVLSHSTRTADERLSAAVSRLAKDFKMRSANSLVKSSSEADDMPLDEKLSILKTKILDKPLDGRDYACSLRKANIPIISEREVIDAVKKVSRQSATSIDGWTKDLVLQCIQHSPNFAADLGVWLTLVLTEDPTTDRETLALNCLRAARLVGIPKHPGVRPIVISNFFMKILGLIATARDDRGLHPAQYAMKTKHGCHRIIHFMRAAYRRGLAIVKIDMANAYNTLKRCAIETALREADPTLQQYFARVYGATASLLVYGPEHRVDTLLLGEGVRQGDSTASYAFCHTVDPVLQAIAQVFPHTMMYMDDLTIACEPHRVQEAIELATRLFKPLGLEVNLSKTGILLRHAQLHGITNAKSADFVVLGVDISDNNKDFMTRQRMRQFTYFDKLSTIDVHPQVRFAIARICGAPRLAYLCQTMMPDVTKELATEFDGRLKSIVEHIVDPSGETPVPVDALHDRYGAGMPRYATNNHKLYEASFTMANNQAREMEVVELITNQPTPHSAHQLCASWMTYDDSLTPASFSAALAARLGVVPKSFKITPAVCDCGTTIANDDAYYGHIFKCDRASRTSHTHRHNLVRDSVARVAREFGITVSKEPTIYPYDGGKRRRPDLLFFVTPTPVATDFTIVSPAEEPGSAAAAADDDKIATHQAATAAMQHGFIPFAMESPGLIGKGAHRLIACLAQAIQPGLQQQFHRRMMRATANGLAQGRADTMFSARHKASWTWSQR